MKFTKRRFVQVVEGLPEAEKLYATLRDWEGLADPAVRRELRISSIQLARLHDAVGRKLAPVVPVSAREVARVRLDATEHIKARCRDTTRARLDRNGRVPLLRQSVVATVSDEALELAAADVRQGDGGELRSSNGPPSFHSAYSSCALAVSAFGPWRTKPEELTMLGRGGFRDLHFEAKCRITGVPGRPPNLDFVAESTSSVLAVESRFTEYLSGKKTANFRPPYAGAVKRLADQSWRALFERLQASPDEFRFLDAAQLHHSMGGTRTCFSHARIGRPPVCRVGPAWQCLRVGTLTLAPHPAS